MPTWTAERSRVARLCKTLPSDHPDVIDARRDYRAARLEDAIRKAVAQAPPLSDEQRRQLAVLLAPVEGASAGGVAA